MLKVWTACAVASGLVANFGGSGSGRQHADSNRSAGTCDASRDSAKK